MWPARLHCVFNRSPAQQQESSSGSTIIIVDLTRRDVRRLFCMDHSRCQGSDAQGEQDNQKGECALGVRGMAARLNPIYARFCGAPS